MSNAIWLFNLFSLALAGFAAGSAWSSGRRSKLAEGMSRKAVDSLEATRDAVAALATDIDAADKRADGIYATLDKHEKTFAKSRRSRAPKTIVEKETTAPKTGDVPSVNNYMTEGGA